MLLILKVSQAKILLVWQTFILEFSIIIIEQKNNKYFLC